MTFILDSKKINIDYKCDFPRYNATNLAHKFQFSTKVGILADKTCIWKCNS